MEKRYGLRRGRNGSWAILDRETGLPAASDGRDLTGLDHEDAADIAEVLNRNLRLRRRSPLV